MHGKNGHLIFNVSPHLRFFRTWDKFSLPLDFKDRYMFASANNAHLRSIFPLFATISKRWLLMGLKPYARFMQSSLNWSARTPLSTWKACSVGQRFFSSVSKVNVFMVVSRTFFVGETGKRLTRYQLTLVPAQPQPANLPIVQKWFTNMGEVRQNGRVNRPEAAGSEERTKD